MYRRNSSLDTDWTHVNHIPCVHRQQIDLHKELIFYMGWAGQLPARTGNSFKAVPNPTAPSSSQTHRSPACPTPSHQTPVWEAVQGKEEVKEVADMESGSTGGPSSLTQGMRVSLSRGCCQTHMVGLDWKWQVWGRNKGQGKGTGFPNRMPKNPTANNGEKRMLNEPMISADHPVFFRTTAKDPRTAELPLGTNGLTEENISEMVEIKKILLCLFFSRLAGHVSLTVCLSLADWACLLLQWSFHVFSKMLMPTQRVLCQLGQQKSIFEKFGFKNLYPSYRNQTKAVNCKTFLFRHMSRPAFH